VVHLVAGTNAQGYPTALRKAWRDLGLEVADAPAKSSLSEARGKLSYTFFERAFRQQLRGFEERRSTYRGLRIYAIDGDQLELPLSDDILASGYRGFPCKHHQETHFPRLYLVHAYDCVSGVTKDLRYGPENQELQAAIDMVLSFEAKSVTLYDRFYLSRKLIAAHAASGSFFLARCKQDWATFKEVVEFGQSNRRNAAALIDGVLVRLVKIVNPRTGKIAVFATNLPRKLFTNLELARLYARRWEVETSFRDSTHTAKLEQWHSKSINGILQELFAHFWLVNAARIQIALHINPGRGFLEAMYKRANFKSTLEFLVDCFGKILSGQARQALADIAAFIRRLIERRTRLRRAYPRQIKSKRKTYPSACLVQRRKR